MNKKRNVQNIFWSIIIFAIIISIASLYSSFQTHKKLFPSFFFDPYGIYSVVNVPTWNNKDLELSRDCKITKIDNQILNEETSYLNYPSNRIYSLLNNKYSANSKISLTLATNKVNKTKVCSLLKIGNFEIVLLNVVYLFFGWFSLLFTLMLWKRISENRTHVNTLLITIILSFVFLATFYDYHTVGWLVPFFQITNVMLPPMILYLCFFYPIPMVSSRIMQKALQVSFGIYLVFTLIDQVLLPNIGYKTFIHFEQIDMLNNFSLILAGLLTILRIWLSKKIERGSFVVIAVANAMLVIVLGGCFALSSVFNIVTLRFLVNLLLPFVPTIFILLFSYSIIQHNILTIRTIFNRKIFIVPILFLAMAITAITFTLLSYGKNPNLNITLFDIVTIISILFFVTWLINKITIYIFFNSIHSFRPTIVQLSDYLSEARNENEIIQKLAEVTNKWLLHHHINVKIYKDTIQDDVVLNHNCMAFPMLSHDKILGVLTIEADSQSPLLTDEDINLLKVIVSIATIGINNIRNTNALDDLHKQNLVLTRQENYLSLQVFGAEIAHEIRYPITYFKYLMQELKHKQELNDEDIELGNEEILRLEKMLSSMRKFKHQTVDMQSVNIYETIKRTLVLLKDILEYYKINPVIDIPASLELRADKNLLIQLFSNLIKNAAEASGEGGLITASLTKMSDDSYSIVIKDSGPGLPDKDIFTPWVTTKKEGRGIGLTVCSRIVRSFDWHLRVERIDNQTCFSINFPSRSIITL